MDVCGEWTLGAYSDPDGDPTSSSSSPPPPVVHLSDRCYLGSDTIDRGNDQDAGQPGMDQLGHENADNDDGTDDATEFAPAARAHRRWWSQRHGLPVTGASDRDTNVRFMLSAAVPMRLYVRAPSPAAMAAVASLFCRSPSRSSSPVSSPDTGDLGGTASSDVDPMESSVCDFDTDESIVLDVCATAPGVDPNLLHAPSAMINNGDYRLGRSAYVAVQHEALQVHRERGVRLLGEMATATGVAMDLSSVLDLYKRRLAVAHLKSLRQRVVALDALYDHTTRGRCTPPEAVRTAASTTSGVEFAAAWYGQWASTAAPLQTPDDASDEYAQCSDRLRRGGDVTPPRPVAWVPVAGNTGVPLAAGAPLFYVGTMPDPLACPVHRDVHGRLTCPPVGCTHRDLLAGVMHALGDARALDALLTELVAADADTTEFALALRSIVNATLDHARHRWGGKTMTAIRREPVDLFSEFPVDAFVLVRMGADGALLPHVIAVAPRLDIELCL
ncbi:hypothetical protein TW95_gp0040 [Pandoravirus inopinatum]|uniref:Uncharacterized protein n=1 Tax=Pandoravirus inopinatum TaxID=1605721 RepID=A0A0B5J020_9VIRU|nr:hypothetical protein TW95_gp0040 [Pandoravirus inopinatum]AJF96774.1 hypothetical protein [Pandoravirus inopinatum]